jgi:hypothetical protein
VTAVDDAAQLFVLVREAVGLIDQQRRLGGLDHSE